MALKLLSVLSARIAMRLNSLNLQKKFSIRCRHLYISRSRGSGFERLGCWEMTAVAPLSSSSAMEALTLRWCDVDFDRHTLSFVKTKTMHRAVECGPEIRPLTPGAARLLRALQT